MTTAQIAIVIVVVAVVAGIAIFLAMRNRSRRLQARFGSEYSRAVQQTGSKLKAEAELQRVEKRVEGYPIRPLSPIDRDRFQQLWRSIQTSFVDDPNRAFSDADELLRQVMSVRGYPMAEFDQRAAELAVDHGHVVEHYRAGHQIAVRHSQGDASTEELRQGMVHYRRLFDELTGEPEQLRRRAAGMGS